MAAPGSCPVLCAFVYSGVIAGVETCLVHKVADNGRTHLRLKQVCLRQDQLQKSLLIYPLEFFILQEPVDQWIALASPLVRILPSRVSHKASSAVAQGHFIIERYEEDLITVRRSRVEIYIEVVASVPVVIPHSNGNIDCICAQQ